MRILLCAYSCIKDPDQRYGDGGEGVLGWNMAKQAARFFEVTVLTHANNRQAIEKKLREEALPRATFHYLALPMGLEIFNKVHGGIQIAAYLWQIKAYLVAKKLHAERPFDLFHHVTYANDWMASFIGALLPVPYVRGPGGGAHKVPKGFLKHYSPKEKFLEGLRGFGQWVFKHDPFFIMGQKKAAKILVCNMEAFDALGGLWKAKAELFPVNGVSGRDMQEAVVPRHDMFTFVTAGKLLKLKNVDLAIRAFAAFWQHHPRSQFIIMGDGPELGWLQALAKNLAVDSAIHFKKWMPREQVLAQIREADVFVFPSLRDGGGAVVVEAMAQQKPVVCFDIAGPGLHVDEFSGIKVQPTDPDRALAQMCGAMEKLYGDEALRLKLGKGALDRVREKYVWERLGDRMQNIYQQAL